MTEAPPGQDKTRNKPLAGREQYWHSHYCRWQKSGLSLAGYARKQGLVVNTFYGWHDRLKKCGLAKPKPAPTAFHRVTIKPAEPSTVFENCATSIRFRLPNGIDCEVALSLANCTDFIGRLSRLRL